MNDIERVATLIQSDRGGAKFILFSDVSTALPGTPIGKAMELAKEAFSYRGYDPDRVATMLPMFKLGWYAFGEPTPPPDPPMPCYYCDPYGYPWATPEGGVYAVCEWHAAKLGITGTVYGRGLLPGWQPSWRRGIWA